PGPGRLRGGGVRRRGRPARGVPPRRPLRRRRPDGPRPDPRRRTRMTLDAFPRHPLLFGPSPVHRLDRLAEHLGGAAVWAKRDDCNSVLAYGGNKTRKLEFLVADALANGCDTLVSIGGVQSNHTRQACAAPARAGMRCVLVQESWVDWPDVVYDRVGNIQLSRIMGADVRLVRAGVGSGFQERLAAGAAQAPVTRR